MDLAHYFCALGERRPDLAAAHRRENTWWCRSPAAVAGALLVLTAWANAAGTLIVRRSVSAPGEHRSR